MERRRKTGNRQGRPGRRRAQLVQVYSYMVYSLLLLALLAALIYHKANRLPLTFPEKSLAVNGILTEVYYNAMKAEQALEKPPEDHEAALADTAEQGQKLPEEIPAKPPEEVPVVDSSQAAGSYEELLERVRGAFENGDKAYLAAVLTYQDSDGVYKNYTDAQIEGFLEYMNEVTADRDLFLETVADQEQYMGQDGEAYVIKLPVIYLNITTETENTTVVVDTFESSQLEANKILAKGPLLPLMEYKIMADNPAWSSGVADWVKTDFSESKYTITIRDPAG